MTGQRRPRPVPDMTYHNTKILAERFARQLSEPADVTICPVCFSSYAMTLSNMLAHHLPRLRAECHVLFDACIRALFLPRAQNDFDKLRLSLAMKHRRCTRPGCKPERPGTGINYLRVFLDTLGQVVHSGLHLGEGSAVERASMTNKAFSDRQGRWPSRVSQLFPYGEQATVDALLDLANLFISASPLGLVNELLMVCRPVLLPLLLADGNRKRMLSYLVRVLDPRERPALERAAPWLFGHGKPLFTTATAFIHAVRSGPNAVPCEGPQFFASRERTLLRVATDIIDTLDDADNAMTLLAPFALDLCKKLGPPTPVPARAWEWTRAQREQYQPAFAPILFSMITQLAHRRRCAAVECARSELQTDDSGKRLQHCARCKVPRYCSKECQAADWHGAGDVVPHRVVCAVLCKIAGQASARLTQEEFAGHYASAVRDFTPDDYVALNAFATTLGQLFGHTFSAEEVATFPPVTLRLHLPENAGPMLPYLQQTLGQSRNIMHLDNSALFGKPRKCHS
ncbi:hypothetical protein AURDEDRAFT_171446 [Auricularia subglabra TFB-10046 SS5]|nr:hypothetical protein AURDEDRAFT_171446 [Auricularia subglabra TFB-10046 SS5]